VRALRNSSFGGGLEFTDAWNEDVETMEVVVGIPHLHRRGHEAETLSAVDI
jgi:hypothetical protein